MKEIRLTKGFVAIVDDEDFEFLSQWKWHANASAARRTYAMRNSAPDADGKRAHIMMHRVVCAVAPGEEVDHINGNGLDNRRANLRPVTRGQSMWNRAPNASGSSRHKGVYWHKQHRKWVAAIQVNKKRVHIGLFTSEDAAARAYAERAAAEFGEFNRREA